jgi:hypothetical protein
MKPWQYITSVVAAIMCFGLAVAIVIVSSARQTVQREVAERQLRLNAGILGAQGQQIRMAILQDMANSAAQNPKMRRLLGRHGYSLQGQSGATNEPPAAKGE